MIEDPLPGMPEPPRNPNPPKTLTGERVSRYSPKARRLCDACIWMIHRFGQGAAPLPRAARWRISTATDSRYVCNDHKETRLK